MKTCLIVCILLCCILVSPGFAQEAASTSQEGDESQEEGEARSTSQEGGESQKKSNDNEVLKTEGIVDVLIVFVVLSVVFEVALTPVFSWRIFLKHCYKKGYRTPIAVGLAFLVFWAYDLNIITQLLEVLNQPIPPKSDSFVTTWGTTWGGKALTALLIAGGSSGIFQIFTRLGLRNPFAIGEKAREAQGTENSRAFTEIVKGSLSAPSTPPRRPRPSDTHHESESAPPA